MYTPTQIELIKEFGKKDLSFGCIVEYDHHFYTDEEAQIIDTKRVIDTVCSIVDDRARMQNTSIAEISSIEILGHIPTLEDVFRVVKEKGLVLRIPTSLGYLEFESQDEEDQLRTKKTRIDYYPHIPLLDQDNYTQTQLLTIFKSCQNT